MLQGMRWVLIKGAEPLHAGAGNAKKWKASIRVQPGAVAEVPAGSNGMTVGRWFDIKGVDFRPAKSVGEPGGFELHSGCA
jgi:hypothetical protein